MEKFQGERKNNGKVVITFSPPKMCGEEKTRSKSIAVSYKNQRAHVLNRRGIQRLWISFPT